MTNKIDLKYRPHSYFWANEIGVQLSSEIKGAERKSLFESLVAQGRGDEIDGLLSKPVLSNEERQSLGRFHPHFMGGEYLPDRSGEEVEIARITIASTTRDVTSVYASQGAKRIHYRVVDEYGGDTLRGTPHRATLKPMTLGQLTDFFLSAWNLLDVLDFNFEGDGFSTQEIKAFVLDCERRSKREPVDGGVTGYRSQAYPAVQDWIWGGTEDVHRHGPIRQSQARSHGGSHERARRSKEFRHQPQDRQQDGQSHSTAGLPA